MDFKDYYKIMGVARDASQDDIKRAHRKLARKYHPDVSKEPDAEERFKEVQEAYEVLKDPEKRAAYDQLGSNWRSGQDFRPPPDWGRGFEFTTGGGGARDDGGFSEFFSSLFGEGTPFGRAHTRGGGAFRSAGQDHYARVEIGLEEAFSGGSRTIELKSPELSPDGHVITRPRTLRVSIPQGVSEGQQIRLQGQGSPGLGGGPPGDLYLEIGLRAHPLYTVEGRDVTVVLPIAPWEAALGATVEAPTLGGRVDVRIPAGARAGQRLRLKGRGLPGRPPGDQFIELRIVLPPAESDQARALYEQMRDELDFDPRAGFAR
jgi:curved DNA-binding protein